MSWRRATGQGTERRGESHEEKRSATEKGQRQEESSLEPTSLDPLVSLSGAMAGGASRLSLVSLTSPALGIPSPLSLSLSHALSLALSLYLSNHAPQALQQRTWEAGQPAGRPPSVLLSIAAQT